MKLDTSYLHFMEKEELRALQAIQIGMRNHEWVPAQLIPRLGGMHGGQAYKIVRKLLKNKFITHINKKYDGYRLTYLGYDYLALHTFVKRGLVKEVLCQIGVGKESDVYKCISPQNQCIVLKLARLGRTSFRTIKKNRQYIQGRSSYNWLYLSRLSIARQFGFMQLLYSYGFPTPKPIDTNRHAILMSLIDGDTLCNVIRISSQSETQKLFLQARQVLVRLAEHGLIHGDYNEFNLMVNQEGSKLYMIDFPQCISSSHPNADEYFDRDTKCIYRYFQRIAEKSYNEEPKDNLESNFRFDVNKYDLPHLNSIEVKVRLDNLIKQQQHISLKQEKELQQARLEAGQSDQFDTQGSDKEEESSEYDIEGQESQQYGEDINGGKKIQQKRNEFEEIKGNCQQNGEELQEKDKFPPQKQADSSYSQEEGNQLQKEEIVEGFNDSSTKEQKDHPYDQQLRNIISSLGLENYDQQISSKIDQQQTQTQQSLFKHPQGLTPYQMRKAAQKQHLQAKRQKMLSQSTGEFISQAVKGIKKRNGQRKGNYGRKGKNKKDHNAIRQGLQLW